MISSADHDSQIEGLFNSLVRVISTAIDARTPYNANHTRNMSKYGSKFCDYSTENGVWPFSEQEKRQFLMSIWLHDIGKLTIPSEVMDKETKLGQRLDIVLCRLREIELLSRIDFLEARISKTQLDITAHTVSAAQELVEKANASGYFTEEALDRLKALGSLTFERDGQLLPWITADELEHLEVRRGTLTSEERRVMQRHVVMTEKMLSQLEFTPDYAMVPVWAARHHELLDGSGYPRGLRGDEIPREVRLLTILDIFDALTAHDRPYREPMPAPKAFSILDEMVNEGKLDGGILKMFQDSRAWEDRVHPLL